MIKLLTYIVILLVILTIAQVVRIFELASELRGVKEEKVSLKDIRMNAKLMLLFVIALFAFSIWQFFAYKDRLLPDAASVHGVELDNLFNFNMVIVGLIFFIVNFVLFYYAYKYYYREGNKATFFAHSNKLELVWTVIPAIVLAVLIIYGLKTWNTITAPIDEKQALVIEVYSKQFDWTARYAGRDNLLGETNYKLISGNNDLGVVSDENSTDDIIVKGEFHLPVNKQVLFKFRSRDVIHSAFLPHFRAQMNTVPGMVTQLHMVPTITTAEMRKKTKDEKFDYVLLCNKICGSAHYNMQMKIVVESEEDYNKWISSQKTFGQSMISTPAASADTSAAEAGQTEIKADTTAHTATH